jgi:hypothetical protein
MAVYANGAGSSRPILPADSLNPSREIRKADHSSAVRRASSNADRGCAWHERRAVNASAPRAILDTRTAISARTGILDKPGNTDASEYRRALDTPESALAPDATTVGILLSGKILTPNPNAVICHLGVNRHAIQMVIEGPNGCRRTDATIREDGAS